MMHQSMKHAVSKSMCMVTDWMYGYRLNVWLWTESMNVWLQTESMVAEW